MKQSLFNFIYQRRPGENVVYNTFSKAVVLLDDMELSSLQSLSKNIGSTDSHFNDELYKNGILVDEDLDEMGFMKYLHYMKKFSNDTLFLTIAPTLDCNFACPYCYENRRAGKMSSMVQDALISYIEKSISCGTRHVDISWYGGEPLMYLDILESLARRIRTVTNAGNCLLSMHLVTNGYLLTPQTVELLDELGVTKIQITLDGLQPNHDVRRPLRNGAGTFDKILENLALFANSPIEVVVRMNVDNQNCTDFKPLKIQVEALRNPNITVYASPVEDINPDSMNEISDFMTTDEFESFTMSICEDGGLSAEDFAVMDNRYCYCTAETEYCYVVDDLGDFYKCWDEVGRREYRCFNILDPENINYSNIAKFLANDPFSDEQCKQCVFLPLCFGGCKFQKAQLDKSVCGFTQESLKKYLEIAYFQ